MNIWQRIKQRLKRWLNGNATDYNAGRNVLSKPNPLYVASIRQFIDEGRTVEFPVRGWSMRVFVEHERDKAVLAPCNGEELKVGDVVLAHVGNDVHVLHRIIKAEDQQLTLMGDGNISGTESCTRSDVVAIVTAWRRKGRDRLDYVSSWKWRAYSKVWVALCPVRRYLLLAWRVLRRLHLVS